MSQDPVIEAVVGLVKLTQVRPGFHGGNYRRPPRLNVMMFNLKMKGYPFGTARYSSNSPKELGFTIKRRLDCRWKYGGVDFDPNASVPDLNTTICVNAGWRRLSW